jgi:small subunit ribosomal protein S4
MKLFLKGARCFSDKCAIEKRNFPPGQHGQSRKAKIVGYGLQLREKQKAKRIYFALESQFRAYYENASKTPGVTGELLIQQLERRLDNVAFRLGFATSRRQARQIVRHGHVQVNGRKVNIPSFIVKPGETVSVRESSKNNPTILSSRDATAHAPSPAWMDVDRENLKGRINSVPRRDELVQIPINEQLIVELYSK